MAHIQPRALFPRFCATLRFSNERQPPVPQLNAFLEGNRDQGAHVLYRERGRRDSALAFVHLTLGGEHAIWEAALDDAKGRLSLGEDTRAVAKAKRVYGETWRTRVRMVSPIHQGLYRR